MEVPSPEQYQDDVLNERLDAEYSVDERRQIMRHFRLLDEQAGQSEGRELRAWRTVIYQDESDEALRLLRLYAPQNPRHTLHSQEIRYVDLSCSEVINGDFSDIKPEQATPSVDGEFGNPDGRGLSLTLADSKKLWFQTEIFNAKSVGPDGKSSWVELAHPLMSTGENDAIPAEDYKNGRFLHLPWQYYFPKPDAPE